jgi:hypothetical protein
MVVGSSRCTIPRTRVDNSSRRPPAGSVLGHSEMLASVSMMRLSLSGHRSSRLGLDTPERRATLRTLKASKPFSASSCVAASSTRHSTEGSRCRPR